MDVVSAATVIAAEWTLLGLCLGLIIARLYLRLRLLRNRLILSDYLVCLSWLSGVWEAVCDLELKRLRWLNVSSTWFNLQSTLDPQLTQKVFFISWFPLFTTQYLNKATLLTFFFFIFPSALRPFQYALWAVTIYSILSYITSILIVFLICLPYNSSGFTFTFCGTKRPFILWTTTWALHFSSDIFIFILPFYILRTLHLDWKKKLGLYVTFGFGVLSISAAVVRFLIVLLTFPAVPTANLEFWCAIDAYCGIVVACLPSLRPYLSLEHMSRQHIVRGTYLSS